jgi:hypothetical protein
MRSVFDRSATTLTDLANRRSMHGMTPAHRVALGVVLALTAARPHAQQSPSLADVLQRAGAYVKELERKMSGVVAEESYSQRVRTSVRIPTGYSTPHVEQRRLKSDVLVMRPDGDVSWVQFRDVFEVDGRPVRDREQRLTALFLKPNATTLQRVANIRRESARYTIGRIERTMNVPVVPLAVLDPDAQPRFAFKVSSSRTNIPVPRVGDVEPSFRATIEVWIVTFEEKRGPTLIRLHPSGDNIFSRGRLWIEPATGRLMMAEMVTENRQVHAQLNVTFQYLPELDYMVPIEMTERYKHQRDPAETTGTATYSNFRQFQVQVDEKLTPIQESGPSSPADGSKNPKR